MRRQGRLGLPFGQKAQGLTGTIIIDQAAFNHLRMRVWWTKDDVLKLSPFQPEKFAEPDEMAMRSPPFDKWVYERYLDEQNGRGVLLWSRVARSVSEGDVQKAYPLCGIVHSYSGRRRLLEMVKGESKSSSR